MSKRKKTRILPLPPTLEDVCAKIPDSINGVKLAKSIKGMSYKEVTIASFCELVSDELKNREELAQFVYDRFHQRYLLPFEKVPRTMNSGFAQMAVCCLMIEAMESFRNGWNDTSKETIKSGGEIFEDFFHEYGEFKEFEGLGKEFYSTIRCGILHQAETKDGWRLVRRWEDPLLNKQNKTIHSTIFRERMELALQAYCNKLKTGEEPAWGFFKTKMAYIIQNCIP